MIAVDIISKIVSKGTGKAPSTVGGESNMNLSDYLLKEIWEKVFEIKTDAAGNEYIFGKLPVVTKYGITMYADDGNVDIPQFAEGLPFDQRTIWFNPETKQIEVIGGTGGVSNFWDLSGIPSWITNTKPKYSYSEIEGTPDLSVLVTGTELSNTLADYATLTYLTGELAKYVTIGTKQTITGEKNFTGGLKVNGSPIYYDATNKYWKLEGDLLVTGGVSMYSNDSEFTPSTIMDGVVVDGTSIRKNPTTGALEVIGGSGATVKYPLSWSGFNQGSYDGSQAVSFYIPTKLSEFVNDRSFATTSDLSGYLPLSGGTVNGILTIGGRLILGNGNAIQFTGADKELLFYPYSKYNGDLGYYNGSSWGKVWTSANDGSGSGLDADLLDGLQPSELYVAGINQVYQENINFKVGHKKLQIISPKAADALDNGFPNGYSSGLSVISNYVGWQMVTYGGSSINNPYFRELNDTNVWSDWKQLAFLTDNVASATKLQTPRTIWGQSFDGTGDVNGNFFMDNSKAIYQKDTSNKDIRTLHTDGSNNLLLGYGHAQSGYNVFINGNNVIFRYGTTPAEGMRLTSAGNVLIGTTTDSGYKLDVNGNVQFGTGDSCNVWLNRTSALSYIHARNAMALTVNNKGADGIALRLDVNKNAYFSNQLHINGIPIYKSQDDVLYIDGNLVVRGGITMYAENEVDVPTLMDSIVVDNTMYNEGGILGVLRATTSSVGVASFNPAHFSVDSNGMVSFIGSSGGAVSGDYLPLSGGTIVGSGDYNAIPLVIKNGIASFSGINICAYNTERVHLGYFGSLGGIRLENLINNYGFAILDDGTPSFYKSYSDGTFTKNTILHTGNYSSYALPLTRAIYHTNGDNPDPNTWDGNWMGMTNQSTPDGTNFFHILSSNWGNATQNNHKYWCAQLALPTAASNHIFYRKGSSETTFNRWVAVLDDSNVGSYALPISGGTLTGGLTVNGDIISAYTIKTTWYNEIAINTANYFNSSYAIYGDNGTHWIRDWTMRNMLHWRDGLSASGYVTGYTIGSFRRTSSFGGIFIAVSNSDGLNSIGASMEIEGNGVIGINAPNYLSTSNNLLVAGGITMYSDIRKKTKLQDVELSLSQISNAPLIQHYYNSDQNKTTHVGSIAQYWAELNDWFCKLDNEGYYTMEIQNCALASAISIARHLEKYESKTDKKIRMLKKRVQKLEDKLKRLEGGNYGCS